MLVKRLLEGLLLVGKRLAPHVPLVWGQQMSCVQVDAVGLASGVVQLGSSLPKTENQRFERSVK
jgi:hypothetical protein